jgi:hypothetical protein
MKKAAHRTAFVFAYLHNLPSIKGQQKAPVRELPAMI